MIKAFLFALKGVKCSFLRSNIRMKMYNKLQWFIQKHNGYILKDMYKNRIIIVFCLFINLSNDSKFLLVVSEFKNQKQQNQIYMKYDSSYKYFLTNR